MKEFDILCGDCFAVSKVSDFNSSTFKCRCGREISIRQIEQTGHNQWLKETKYFEVIGKIIMAGIQKFYSGVRSF